MKWLVSQKTIVMPSVYNEPPAYLFDASAWPEREGRAGAGRGNTWFVSDGAGEFALRHYRRGGLIARVLKDSYLALGAQRSRSFLEWRLLDQMHTLGLPVPEPIAARYRRVGLFYTADLVTRLIPNSDTLAACIANADLGDAGWTSLGAVLRRFHDAGVFHADLNAHNILRDREGRYFLLDFDRGSLRPPGDWCQANLSRLRRSLDKLFGESLQAHFNEAHWAALLEGYG